MKKDSWAKQVIGGATWCEICGENFVILSPHHYIHKSQCPPLKAEIRNGIRLCETGENKCHIKAHGIGGKEFISDWMRRNRPADKAHCDKVLKEYNKIT